MYIYLIFLKYLLTPHSFFGLGIWSMYVIYIVNNICSNLKNFITVHSMYLYDEL